jgi:hypothetical protein
VHDGLIGAVYVRVTGQDGSDDPEGRQKNRRVEITVKK